MKQKRYIDLVDDLRNRVAETPWLEFKVNQEDQERIGILVSALSNAAAIEDRETAYLVWGIEDGTHKVLGNTFDPFSKRVGNQVFELWLREKLRPAPAFQFREVPHPEGRVVLLEVPAATVAPTTYDGIPYIRVGSATPKLSDDIKRYHMLIEKLRPYKWESGVAIDYLAPKKVLECLDYKSYFRMTDQPLPSNQDRIFEILEREKLIQSDAGGHWNILNLGAILFAADLEDFDEDLQRKALRIVKYGGSSQAAAITNSRDGKRGYAVDFADILDYINGLVPQNETIGQALRVSNPDFSPVAIRELVANALIHQDMNVTGASPRVELFEDRIEITNPGSPQLDPHRMVDQPPQSRNSMLARLMRRMRMCEENGSGMKKVFSEIEETHYSAPLLEAKNSHMRVVIYKPRTFKDMTKDQRIWVCYWHTVMRYSSEREKMRNTTLCKRFGIDSKNAAQASSVIRSTLDAGLIKHADESQPRLGYHPIWA